MSRRKSKRHLPKEQPKQVLAKFDLAQTTADNRKHWANADGLAARAAVSPAVRRVVRIRSRYEAENNSWYSGILRTASNHIIGCGPQLQVSSPNAEGNGRLERAFDRWCRDVDFVDTLRIMFEAYWRDGEVFMMRADRPQNYPMALDTRVIEADQVANPWVGTSYAEPFVDDGIRFDRSTNELEIYVYDHHPGSNVPMSTLEGKWYSSAEVLHLFRAERPGQTRGIPRATPALQTLPIMRRQELATLYSAETAANFAMYLKSTSPAIDPTTSPADFAEIEIARNMLTTLPAGWELGQVEPKQPGPQYKMFQQQTLQSFCRCTNMPYTLAAGTGMDANFSSFKGDMKNVWEPEVKCEQQRIETAILERVLQWFLEAAVFVPGLLDGMPAIYDIEHRWQWQPLPELDQLESANTTDIQVKSGQSSLSRALAAKGLSWEVEAARAAQDFGVDIATYKAAVFQKTFGLTGPIQPPAIAPAQEPAALPAGEYTDIGQRSFSNNQKRIRQTLDSLARGEMSRRFAELTLASIGVPEERIRAFVADALDGALDNTQLLEVQT